MGNNNFNIDKNNCKRVFKIGAVIAAVVILGGTLVAQYFKSKNNDDIDYDQIEYEGRIYFVPQGWEVENIGGQVYEKTMIDGKYVYGAPLVGTEIESGNIK